MREEGRVGIFCRRKNCKRFEPVVVDGWKEGGKKERRGKVKKGYLGCLVGRSKMEDVG